MAEEIKDQFMKASEAASTSRRPRRFYPRMRVCQKCLKVTNDLEYHQAYFCYYFRLNPSELP